MLVLCAGKGLGSVFAGLAYERFGAVRTFQGCAVIAVASLIIYFLLHKLVIKAPPLEEKEGKILKGEIKLFISVFLCACIHFQYYIW